MRGLKHADAIETRPSCAPWTGEAPVSTPAVEVLDDAIVRNDLADHWSRILGLRNGQVNESRTVGRAASNIPITPIDRGSSLSCLHLNQFPESVGRLD
jgi:hypothetical protein